MKKTISPTEFDLKALRALSNGFGAILEQSEYPKKTYFIVDCDGARLGMYLMAEVTRWWKAGWIVCRMDDRTSPSQSGEYILTDAGSDMLEGLTPPKAPVQLSLLESRYEN
ncbi:MAG TPA: hypothetical protein VGV37_13355 [Aliidongia sp.]|uniref:hypothetical protein n=1 Tax=Aliidongia sp. TaxID=1914230 RepID=UPI002DDD94FF|nr:hypothetical protein [Aliidongia sp.]HEV2675525.1 hypothetical protein [Aliidongia sp.]